MRKKFIYKLAVIAFLFCPQVNIVIGSSSRSYLKTDFKLSARTKQQIIYAETDLSVQINVDNIPLVNDFSFKVIEKDQQEDIQNRLENIQYAYSVYKISIQKMLPKTIYLVTDIINTKTGEKCNAFYIESENAVYLDINNKMMVKTIHHELFHALSSKIELNDEFLEKFRSSGTCDSVSQYACTNEEELAEAWAYTFINPMKSEKVKLMAEEIKPELIKKGH